MFLVAILPLFLAVAILLRFFQATGDIRKLLREVEDIRDLVATDFEAKHRKPPAAPPLSELHD